MISAGERPHTYALDGAATGTGIRLVLSIENTCEFFAPYPALNNQCSNILKHFKGFVLTILTIITWKD
jgi:hypothetical protein